MPATSNPKLYVRKAFEKYLECGIFAHGFARARCDDCGHDFLVAFSCKGRGVCPSCNTRRMAETAAHLGDHVFPRLPVRQWVLSVPKRLRYFMQRDGVTLGMVLRIFLRVIAQTLQANSPGAQNPDKAALHIGTATLACWLRTRRTGLRSRRWLQRSRQSILQHRRQTQRRAGQRMIARPSLYPCPSNALRAFCGRC